MAPKHKRSKSPKNSLDDLNYCPPSGTGNNVFEHGHIHHQHTSTCNHHHSDNNKCNGNAHEHHSDDSDSCCGGEHEHHSHDKHWLKAALGIGFGVIMLALSLAGIAMPATWVFIITGISVALTVYIGYNIFKDTFNSLRKKKLGHTTLYTISALTLITVSIVALFVPGLLIVGETAAMILGFWHLGEAIEHSLKNKIKENLDLRERLPKKVKRNGEYVALDDLKEGDIIEVEPGTIIPVDGITLQDTFLITSRVDGSSKTKRFAENSDVISGMEIPKSSKAITIAVSKTYINSRLYTQEEKLKAARKEKADLELFAQKVLKYFTPVVLSIALLSGIIIGSFFSPLLAIQCAIAVLVSACPCVLYIITPLTAKIAQQKSGDLGVTIKDSKALQRAAEVTDTFFDLNGTLTEGIHTVTEFNVQEEYLPHLSLLERDSEHHIAKAIKKELKTKKFDKDAVELDGDIDNTDHSGLSANINGEKFIIGNEDILKRNNVTNRPAKFNQAGKGHIFFAMGNTVIGQIKVKDKIRPDAYATLLALKKRGIKSQIATGDSFDSAKEYVEELNQGKDGPVIAMEDVYADSSGPGRSKTIPMQAVKDKKGKPAFIGDSANDREGMQLSHLAVATITPVSHEETQSSANIILKKGELFPLVQTLEIASAAKTTTQVNLFISITYNISITLIAAGIFVALGLTLNPVIGVALMIVESALVMGILLAFKGIQVHSSMPDNEAADKVKFFKNGDDIKNTSGNDEDITQTGEYRAVN